MAYETLEIRQDGAVAWLILNRPHVLNALSYQLVEDLHRYFDSLRTDKQTRVVIIKGAGRAFCAGLDLKENRPREASGGERGKGALGSTSATLGFQRRISDVVIKMHRLPQPFIAAVHGQQRAGDSRWHWPARCESRVSRQGSMRPSCEWD